MARKSKTQRAKASANRAEKKEQALVAAQQPETVVAEPETKKGLFQKKASSGAETSKEKKAKEEKPKKQRFKFFREVREEMKRVTWPSRKDVIRWSGVVIVALLFFGIYVAILDEIIANALTQYASLATIIGA